MKKKKIIAIIAASVVAIYLVCVNAWNMSLKASFSREEGYEAVIYNDRVYKQKSLSDYQVDKDYETTDYPKTYIRSGNIRKYYRFASSYFVPRVSNTIDKTESFIVVDPDDSSLNMTYVAEDFVFPKLNEETVECISNAFWDDGIYDRETVTKFVNAALNGEEIEIADEFLNHFHFYTTYGVENWNLLFKYKDCPLYSGYCIIKTESGKYRIVEPSELY